VAAGEKYSRWGCRCQKLSVTIPIKEPKSKDTIVLGINNNYLIAL
jgi:hypothetical protein